MLNVSYNLSPTLKDDLEKIEVLRRKILLIVLSPEVKLRFRWEAKLAHIFWSLHLSESPLSREVLVKILTVNKKKKLLPKEKDAVNYKKAIDYIYQNWLVSEKPITVKTILTLHDLACQGRLRESEKVLKRLADYLSVSQDNPIIQAAIAQIQLTHLSPFTDGNGCTGRLLALLILSKSGYDFRGFVSFEEYFGRDKLSFREVVRHALDTKNLTLWLEYFTKGMITQLEKTIDDIDKVKFHLDLPSSFWSLNDRQKDILGLFDEPDISITNRKIQKTYSVSQITASRDLSRLATLGLIYPHGKGRSVYYTKI